MAAQLLVIADNLESGQRAIELLREAGYEAVLDDGTLPDADLLVVDVTRLRGAPLAGLRAARQLGHIAPAILLAARLSEEMAVDVFRLGIREFLLKPVDPDALGRAVTAQLTARAATVDVDSLQRQLNAADETLRRRIEEQRAVTAIGRAVTQVHDLDAVLARIVEAASYLAEAEEGGLFLWEAPSNELVLRASRGLGAVDSQGLRLRVADTIAGECFRTGTPVLRKRAGGQAGLKVKTGLLVEALINVPLGYGNRRIGVLGVYNRGVERGFEDRHLEIMLALADWAAVAIETARLVSSLEATVAERTQALDRALEGTPSAHAPYDEGVVTSALDLRGSLTVILSEAEALLAAAYGPLEPMQAESANRLRRQASSLLAQIDSLTAPTAPAGPNGGRAHAVRLSDLAHDVAEIMSRAVAAKGLSLSVDVPETLPPLPAHVDAIRVRQILLSMLNASLQYTDQGGLTITGYQIRVADGMAETPLGLPPQVRLGDGRWMALALADTGRGYPENELLALWRNVPAGTPAGVVTSIEITLPQARHLAHELGGELWAENTRGAGATFTLALLAATGRSPQT